VLIAARIFETLKIRRVRMRRKSSRRFPEFVIARYSEINDVEKNG
jgi:hypothetical protein